MNELFQACVDLLRYIAAACNTTYEIANIWIFVIIHPSLTLFFMILSLKYYLKARRNAK